MRTAAQITKEQKELAQEWEYLRQHIKVCQNPRVILRLRRDIEDIKSEIRQRERELAVARQGEFVQGAMQ